ncbi:MAG TPA: hypothetical protein VFO10_06525, partial [Oligoflexus sp.]|uniref:hypothetical protein n=1 Tax=Oligoflexus sp. TaxID=1971216 RepID=UPI002D7FCD4F
MEAIQLSEVDRLRFRVHREQGVVTFYGSIGDTPDTAALDGILLNGSICDMRNLVFASWIGLATIGEYIQQRQMKVSFRALPFSVYDAMRLNKAFEDQTFLSAELPLVHKDTQRISYEMIEFAQLRSDAEKGNEWVHPQPGCLLLIPTRYIFPDLAGQRSIGHLPVQVLTPQKEIASFWLQYGAFSQSTVAISNTLIHAAKFNMNQILSEIKAKTAAGENALKLIDSTINHRLVPRLETMMQDIEKEFDTLSNKVQQKFEDCEKQLAGLSLLALNKGCEASAFTSALENYARCLDSLTQIATICEDCGGNIGDKLGAVRVVETIKQGLTGIAEPAPDALTAMRAAFAIMDIMSEDDWPASRELILAEIDAIDALTGRSVVTLQVFDMMRQILEHRIREVGLMLSALTQSGPEALLDPELRDAVLNKIGAQLVTEQEKAAFAFFLPDGFQKFGQT